MSEFDPNWPHGHITRDGRKARIICCDLHSGGGETIVAAVTNKWGFEEIYNYPQNGMHYERNLKCITDLLNAPAPKRRFEFWVNVHGAGGYWVFASRIEADKHAGLRIACLHVTGEEGDGL